MMVALFAEMSLLSHFSARSCPSSPPPCPYPFSLVKVVLFGEIEVNPSDVKHVMKLVGYSDGLGVVVTAHTHRRDVI